MSTASRVLRWRHRITAIGTLDATGRSIATADAQGKETGAVGHADVTSAGFEKFIELVPDAIVGTNLSGAIVFANSRAAELFGCSRDMLLGMHVNELVPDRFHDAHDQERTASFQDLRRRPMHSAVGLVAKRLDGTEFPADISLMWLETERGSIATTAIRDISDRAAAEARERRLESELMLNQAKRLESVGQLAGGVAHDFNNQLAVILNYARFVRDAIEDQPALRQDMDSIITAAERAAELTSQLLVFSQRDVIKPSLTNVNDLVEELCDALRADLGENTSLSVNLSDDIWTVSVDRDQLRQSILALVENARHAMPDGGVLGIETANVELDEIYIEAHPDVAAAGRYVRVSVTDDGIGMTPEVRERAFEPFFSTKDKAIGNGLGLATVYGSVRQVGGNVFLYSEQNRGTSVKIHLPAVESPLEAEVAVATPRAGTECQYVLVVEDEEAVRRLVERMLATGEYDVTLCASGEQALELLADKDNVFDVMLTDMVMPQMQGTELAERAHELRPELRIVFMSGYSESVIAKQLSGDEPIDLLEKPFTMEALLNKVRNTADSDRPVAE